MRQYSRESLPRLWSGKGDGLRAMATTQQCHWPYKPAVGDISCSVSPAGFPSLQQAWSLCILGTHSLLIFTSDRQMPVGPLKGINQSLVSSSPFPFDLITLLPGMSYLATAESPIVPV